MKQLEKALIKGLFPNLKGKWGEINLNEIAKDLSGLLSPMLDQDENPFLDPDVCENWKNFIHKVKGIDYSFGGYMEDRSVVWSGHYHEPGHVTHLGVDFYVPEGSLVFLPVEAELISSEVDEDQNGGWGGKLVFRWKHGYFILAHLKGIITATQDYGVGRVVGVIAEPEKNGNWSPHLHLQCMTTYNPSVDGYAKYYDGIEKDFPNPLTLRWS